MSKLPIHKVFISYHHANDQEYKSTLLDLNTQLKIFIDRSVDTGNIDTNLPDETIRMRIRDEYLRDSTVTILLVGKETASRKHIDWELYSSMIDGKINKKSGIVVVQLPSIDRDYFTVAHGDIEKKQIYPDIDTWYNVESRSEYEKRYPYLPPRMIDQLLAKDAKVSVTHDLPPYNRTIS